MLLKVMFRNDYTLYYQIIFWKKDYLNIIKLLRYAFGRNSSFPVVFVVLKSCYPNFLI